MRGTAGALAFASAGQNRTLPTLPATQSAWEGFRRRNTVLDGIFYDVKRLSPQEAAVLGAIGILEGSLLLVPPSGAGDVVPCATIDEFVAVGGAAATSLCISGVGSSALGTAAFARNIADATGKPAAAVVSGYGLSDVMTEALGGWFFFGIVNQYRHALEGFQSHVLPAPKPDTGSSRTSAATGDRLISRDTQSAFALLCDKRLNFDVLTGHSKGNLVLSEALYRFKSWCDATQADPHLNRLIVTFSAAIAMPRDFPNIVDVMGGADPLGRINSRPDIGIEKIVPWSGHYTNTDIPGHLPVTRVMGEILADG